MDEIVFLQNAHFYLGITRKEINRRLSEGLLDLTILQAQIEQNAKEFELDVICEMKIKQNSLEQADKFEDSAL